MSALADISGGRLMSHLPLFATEIADIEGREYSLRPDALGRPSVSNWLTKLSH
jgi:hypothetical protein